MALSLSKQSSGRCVRHRVPLPGGSYDGNTDHEGIGTADAQYAARVCGNPTCGGWTYGSLTSTGTIQQTFSVTAGQHVRIVLTWDSHTSGTMFDKTDTLTADLDLLVSYPGGQRASTTWDNNDEFVGFAAPGLRDGHDQRLQGAVRCQLPSTGFSVGWHDEGARSDSRSLPCRRRRLLVGIAALTTLDGQAPLHRGAAHAVVGADRDGLPGTSTVVLETPADILATLQAMPASGFPTALRGPGISRAIAEAVAEGIWTYDGRPYRAAHWRQMRRGRTAVLRTDGHRRAGVRSDARLRGPLPLGGDHCPRPVF